MQLKGYDPEPSMLINTIRYKSVHLNDDDTPAQVQAILND